MLELCLVHGSLLKKVLEAMKELVMDANFDCSSSGVSLQAMDSSHVALVALLLRFDGFEHFRYDRNRSMGMNINHISKLLRCTANNDVITLRADDDSDTITFIFESPRTMGRAPCCVEVGLKKGPWTPEEDKKLTEFIQKNGHHGSWRLLPKLAGLNRCGKSCRLRWTNYLRPDIKRGMFSEEEEKLIVDLHSVLGNKWSSIAARLPGRTDNEIKNYWNTHLRKKLVRIGIDPVTHMPRTDLNLLGSLSTLLAADANFRSWSNLDNVLKLQRDAARLARMRLAQKLIQVLTNTPTSGMDLTGFLGSASLRNRQLSDLLQLSQYEGLINSSLSLHGSSLPNMSFQNLLNSVHACTNSSLSLDGEVAASEHGTESNCFSANSNVFPTTNTTPPLLPASPEDTHMEQTQGPITSNNISSTSAPFEAWEDLNLDDLSGDFGWKEILDAQQSI